MPASAHAEPIPTYTQHQPRRLELTVRPHTRLEAARADVTEPARPQVPDEGYPRGRFGVHALDDVAALARAAHARHDEQPRVEYGQPTRRCV